MRKPLKAIRDFAWQFRENARRRARHRADRDAMKRATRENIARLASLKAGLPAGQRLVCIGLVEHFGDIIACEPVAREVRQRNPEAYLIWFVNSRYRELVADHPALNEIVTVSCLSEYTGIVKGAPIDELVDLHFHRRACSKFGTVHTKSRGNLEIGEQNYYFHGESILEVFCKCGGLPVLTDGPRMYIPPSVSAAVDKLVPEKRFIVVHASSNEKSRDWLPEKWEALVTSLSLEPDLTIVEVGLRPVLAGHVPGVFNLCGRLTLLQLAETIRRATAFVGVDSGPAHMANAFERPSVILLGRYRVFDRYMPYSGFLKENEDEMILRWTGPAAEIPVEVAKARVEKILSEARRTQSVSPF